jgi:uncharacterized metal-binding protein YceD (DUF177 family)
MVVDMEQKGEIILLCDRCLEPYPQPLYTRNRVIYSFDKFKQFDGDDEVIPCNKDESRLSLVQELYDFMAIQVPLRHIAPKEVHLCDPEVLRLLHLDPDGNPPPNLPAPEPDNNDDDDSGEIDPRWAALKNLK